MKFKPTLWKSISSIVFGIIIGYLWIYIINYYTYLGKGPYYEASMTLGMIWFLYISPIALIYIIWSLIEKKK